MREWSRRGAWALVAGLVLGACSEGGDSGPVGLSGGPNAALEVRQVAGEEQEGQVGEMLGQPLVLEVVNADGSPAPGVEVQWVFESGRGATSSTVALAGRTTRVVKQTDANGRAEVWWEMGTIPGAQQAIGGLAVEEAVGVPSGGPQGASWRWFKRVFWRAYAKTGSPAVVEVSPASATVGEADKIVLSATVKDQYGNVVPDAPVSWVSSNETVAKVDTAGTVEAAQEGEATIVARSGTLEGASTVAVIDNGATDPVDPEPVPAVQRVVAQPDTIRFSYVGQEQDLTARAFDGTGAEVSGVTFTYQTSNSSIARVGTMGRVTARAVGTALIAVSALCCDVADSVVVIVDDVPREIAVRVNGNTITSDTLDLEVGQTATLSAEALNEIGNVIPGVTINWTSSNTSVVRTDASGVATAVGAGRANLTASARGVTAVVPTRVTEPATQPQLGTLRVSPSTVALTGVGSTMQLGVTARDAAGNTISAGSVTWQSRNTAVATVSSNGLVTARGIGTVMLVVSAACCESVEVPVTVTSEETLPTGDVAFESNWSTATGNSASALRDGGIWDTYMCSQYADYLHVIPATTGFPAGMQNVLRVGAGGATGCGMVKSTNRVSAPAVGESRFYRVYLKYVSQSNNLSNQHFLQPNSENLPHAWNWRWQRPSNGRVRLEWVLVNQLHGWPNRGVVFGVMLDVGTVYRLEYELRRTGVGTAQMFPRIYLGDTNTLVYDASNFQDVGEAVQQTMAQANPTILLESVEDLYTFELGQNGPAGSTTVTNDFFQAGGFAVSYNGWVGPWSR